MQSKQTLVAAMDEESRTVVTTLLMLGWTMDTDDAPWHCLDSPPPTTTYCQIGYQGKPHKLWKWRGVYMRPCEVLHIVTNYPAGEWPAKVNEVWCRTQDARNHDAPNLNV